MPIPASGPDDRSSLPERLASRGRRSRHDARALPNLSTRMLASSSRSSRWTPTKPGRSPRSRTSRRRHPRGPVRLELHVRTLLPGFRGSAEVAVDHVAFRVERKAVAAHYVRSAMRDGQDEVIVGLNQPGSKRARPWVGSTGHVDAR